VACITLMVAVAGVPPLFAAAFALRGFFVVAMVLFLDFR
jgi:hypothetical protein